MKTEEKEFHSGVDSNYMIKCWKDNHVAYAFHIKVQGSDVMAEPTWSAIEPMNVPKPIVDELLPQAGEWLGLDSRK